MRKLLLVFLLLQIGLFAQLSNTNIWMMRGDTKTLSFNYNGNILNDSLIFVVKSSKEITAVRLISKTTYNNQINILFGVSSFVYVRLDAGDTDDLTLAKYYYDITRIHNGDSTTIFIGELNLQPDIGTPFDGTDVTGRVTTVSLANGSINRELVWWNDSLNFWEPSGVTVSSAGSVGDADSLGGVPASEYLVKSDSTDQRTFSDAKYVDKTSTQDITGQKNFTNNKTVFGTTANDSVGIRGDLVVDGAVYFYGSDGDIDNSGSINVVDVNLIQNYLNYNASLTKLQKIKADINGDGVIDWSDREIVGLLNGSLTGTPEYIAKRDSIVRVVNSYNRRTSYLDYYVDGNLTVEDTLKMANYTFPMPDGAAGQIQKTDGNGNLYWASDATGAGGAAYTDSVVINGRNVPGDSIATIDAVDSLLKVPGNSYKLSYSGLVIDGWFGGINAWTIGLSNSSPLLRIGKTGREIYFSDGAAYDYMVLTYATPAYNSVYNWLYPIEHRTDYYNDTLQTVAHSDILNVDGTGTPRWKTNDVRITGNQIEINVGDFPDSTTLDWASAGLFGNNVIISEANKTGIGSTRFPMPVYGYNFKFGSSPDYRYPYVYGFYSDLTTNSPHLETAYHFYGKGDYPSYFGGNIQTDGILVINDVVLGQVSIEATGGIGGNVGIRTGETVQVEGDSPSFGFKIGANISDIVPPEPMTSNWDWALPNKSGTIALLDDISAGGTDSNTVIDLALAEIQTWADTAGYESAYTGAEIDKAIGNTLYLVIKTNPDSATTFTLLRTKAEIVIDSVFALVQGTSALVDFNLAYGTNRTSGTNVFGSSQSADNVTVGETFTTFSSATIPVNNMIWLNITNTDNTPEEFLCVIYYH